MRDFVSFIFHHNTTMFLLCYGLTIVPIYGIMYLHFINSRE
jgi:hypothetical protein